MALLVGGCGVGVIEKSWCNCGPAFIVLVCIMFHESGIRDQGIPDHEGFIWDLRLLCA